VFVPDSAITLHRPQGQFHPAFNVILTVASPLITAVYLGIAQKAVAIAIAHVRKHAHPKPHVVAALGAMHNDLVNAELNWRDMVRVANDLAFAPTEQQGHDASTRKTNVTKCCIAVVTQAMTIVGGQAYYRDTGLERLFRDVQAARYHPMQEPDQLQFSGEFLLKSPPA
jgi:alkylation response protein AidB-like acyl-CoA dehydrogenase